MSIKKVQRFTVTMGTFNSGGIEYYTLGAAPTNGSISSTDGLATISSEGSAARFVFVNPGVSFNPNKTFLTISFSGHSASTNEGVFARIYSGSGYPSSSTTSFNQIQIYQRGNWPVSSYSGGLPTNPAVSIEVVEFD
jgi:hypothetical protein